MNTNKGANSLTDIFDIGKKIDEGSFGRVYRAKNKQTGETVAIKRFKKSFKNWEDCISVNEIRFLKNLKHPNIIRLKEVIKEKEELFLIYEYADTNLLKFYSHYKNKVKLKEQEFIRGFHKKHNPPNSKRT